MIAPAPAPVAALIGGDFHFAVNLPEEGKHHETLHP